MGRCSAWVQFALPRVSCKGRYGIGGGPRATMDGQASWRAPGLQLRTLATAALGLRLARRLQTAWVTAGTAAIGIGAYFWFIEGGLADTVFAVAVTLACGAAIVLVGRRILVAVVLARGDRRHRPHGLQRQAGGERGSAPRLRSGRHSARLVDAGGGLVGDTAASRSPLPPPCLPRRLRAWIAARFDATRVSAPPCSLRAGRRSPSSPGPPMRHEGRGATPNSTSRTSMSPSSTRPGRRRLQALWRGRLIEAAGPHYAAPERFDAPPSCSPATKPPHIVLIHQESVVPPALFPALSYDRSLDTFFHSFDGRLNKLRVETFGGASWLTEFSVLTGLSGAVVRGDAPVPSAMMAGGVKRYAAPGARTLRLSQRHVLSDAAPLPRLRQVLRGGRHPRDLRRQGAGGEAAQRARPVLLCQCPRRDRPPCQGIAAAAVRLHPDHGRPRRATTTSRARGGGPGRRTRYARRDERIPAAPRHGPHGL